MNFYIEEQQETILMKYLFFTLRTPAHFGVANNYVQDLDRISIFLVISILLRKNKKNGKMALQIQFFKSEQLCAYGTCTNVSVFNSTGLIIYENFSYVQ